MHRLTTLLPVSLVLLGLGVSGAQAGQPTRQKTPEQQGKELWERHCVACHGPGNRGDGPATKALVAKVPDLRGKVKANDAATKIVIRGKGSMPGYEATLTRNEVRHVLNHMAKVHSKAAAKEGAKAKGKAKAKNVPPAGK